MSSLRNIALFIIFGGIAAYVALVVLGSVVDAQVEREGKKVIVRDVITRGMHSLSGMVMVPSKCHKLISRVKEIDISNYLLTFRVWEDPNRTCREDEVPQQFFMTLFAASAGITFQATLDEVPIPLEVISSIGE